MLPESFDRETVLDLSVNVIPLGIILFFVLAFLVVNPFGWDPVYSTLQYTLLVAPFVLLAILTYYAGKAVSEAEAETEAAAEAAREGDAEAADH